MLSSSTPPPKPAAAEGHTLAASVVGDIVGSDGLAYTGTDYDNLPTDVTAVAMVCDVRDGHGLALALTDETTTIVNWTAANTACSGKTPAIDGCTWKLPSKDEWENMLNGTGNYTDIRNGFESVGVTNLLPQYYWSSTVADEYGFMWEVIPDYSNYSWYTIYPESSLQVRACLSF